VPPGSRLRELEGAAGRIGRVGQPTGPVEAVGEPIERSRGLRPLTHPDLDVGEPAERALVPWRERQRPLIRGHGVVEPAHLAENAADARVGQRAIGRDLGGLAVCIDRGLVPAAKRRDVAAPEGVLVALV
jgi:hypothetical protein